MSLIADTTQTAVRKPVPEYLVPNDLPDDIRKLELAGEFAKAEKLLQERSESGTDARELKDELERLRWLRRDFSADADTMFRKVQRAIPDLKREEFDAWAEEGAIQSIIVDGTRMFFRREPNTFLKLNKAAIARREAATGGTRSASGGDPAGSGSSEFDMDRHIGEVFAAAEKTSGILVLPKKFKVKHIVTIKPGVVPEGEVVRCWMPYPKDYRQQKGGTNLVTSPEKHFVAPNDVPQRTIFMEQPAPSVDREIVFTAEYEYESSALVTRKAGEWQGISAKAGIDVSDNLKARPPHVEFAPAIAATTRNIVGNETDPVRKAEVIWHWIDENIRWCGEMEYAILPRIVEKVFTERRGDCGTQSLLFMTMCRLSGIPARWQSGWVTKPGAWNMHDWAEFYIDGKGWIPADPSLGTRTSDDVAVRDFFFGNLDSYRMIANTDYAQPFNPPKTHLRSDPVDNQRGEVEWKGGNLYYDVWEYDISVTSTNAENSTRDQ